MTAKASVNNIKANWFITRKRRVSIGGAVKVNVVPQSVCIPLE